MVTEVDKAGVDPMVTLTDPIAAHHTLAPGAAAVVVAAVTEAEEEVVYGTQLTDRLMVMDMAMGPVDAVATTDTMVWPAAVAVVEDTDMVMDQVLPPDQVLEPVGTLVMEILTLEVIREVVQVVAPIMAKFSQLFS